MPRVGWRRPETGCRFSGLLSVGVLRRVFPPGLVDEVIAAAGKTEQCHRSVPARVVASVERASRPVGAEDVSGWLIALDEVRAAPHESDRIGSSRTAAPGSAPSPQG